MGGGVGCSVELWCGVMVVVGVKDCSVKLWLGCGVMVVVLNDGCGGGDRCSVEFWLWC